MSDWSDGYVTNVEYTSHFYAYLSPAAQNFSLLLDGIMPPGLAAGFSYCELGCGHGYTTALLAAAHPQGRFWGVDFNPAHIAGAKQLQARAGLANLTFLERSFAELPAAALPEFDFIALHGVWSWISRANRDAIVAFIRANLKPGGIVYISYNAMPGWAGIAPLRQLFIESQRQKTVTDLASVDEAMDFAKRMRAADALFFKFNPIAGASLDQLDKMPKNYLLHEYFNQEWSPSYFSEVATELAAAKLAFGCSSDVVEHIEQLCLSPEAQAQIGAVPDPVARQTIRDYFRNSRFRRDLFARGARKLSASERAAMLSNQRFALAQPAPEFPWKGRFPAGEVTLEAHPHGTIARRLGQGPVAFSELVADPAIGAQGPQAVFQALLLLVAAGQAQPVLSPDGEVERREATQRFNRAVMMHPLGLEAQTLASPVSGNGVHVPRLDQFFLSQPDATADDILRLMADRRLSLLPDGEVAPPQAELRQGMEQAFALFRNKHLPLYRALGIAAG